MHAQLEAENIATKTRSEWTMLKEIIGTFVGIAPFVVMLVIWGSSINERIRVVEVEVGHLGRADEKQEREAAEQRKEVLARMDKISGQIEVLQQTVAKQAK